MRRHTDPARVVENTVDRHRCRAELADKLDVDGEAQADTLWANPSGRQAIGGAATDVEPAG